MAISSDWLQTISLQIFANSLLYYGSYHAYDERFLNLNFLANSVQGQMPSMPELNSCFYFYTPLKFSLKDLPQKYIGTQKKPLKVTIRPHLGTINGSHGSFNKRKLKLTLKDTLLKVRAPIPGISSELKKISYKLLINHRHFYCLWNNLHRPYKTKLFLSG